VGFFFFFWCGIGAGTQGLHLEPLHQAFFVMDVFWDRFFQTICLSWLLTECLMSSASWGN
jgi:hypothetical protein